MRRSIDLEKRMINTAIELHDSTLIAVRELDQIAVVELIACLHESEGQPGRNHGTVWRQNVQIMIAHANVIPNLISLPDNIADGMLVLGGETIENVFPVPQTFDGDCCIRLDFANDKQLVINGNRIQVTVHGDRQFKETFQA